jgi:hypothetical protein
MTPFRDPPNHAPKLYVSQKMRVLHFDATGQYSSDIEIHKWYLESCVKPYLESMPDPTYTDTPQS